MDFAKKLMNKYGWKDGDGLGKNNDGIAKPLRANLKFDNAGLGADQAASDFNNHWWERVFNEASNNVAVKSQDGGVSMDLKNHDESVEISTKGYSVKKLKKTKNAKNDEKYENFLQSATLTKAGDEVELPDRITATDIEVQKFKQLTDEELFKACGGRTAHKGARHGLKLSGKLARLEQQEQEMLAKMLAKSDTLSCQKPLDEIKKKKKKRKAEIEESVVEGVDEQLKCTNEGEQGKELSEPKKKRKSNAEREEERKSDVAEMKNEMGEQIKAASDNVEEAPKSKKKKKNKKSKQDVEETSQNITKSKKRKA